MTIPTQQEKIEFVEGLRSGVLEQIDALSIPFPEIDEVRAERQLLIDTFDSIVADLRNVCSCPPGSK